MREVWFEIGLDQIRYICSRLLETWEKNKLYYKNKNGVSFCEHHLALSQQFWEIIDGKARILYKDG